MIGRKQCWGLLILFVALIAFPYCILTYNWAKNSNSDEDQNKDRASWDALPAQPGLVLLNMPITNVVVTQTYDHFTRNDSEVQIDERERCMNEVRFILNEGLLLIMFSRTSAQDESVSFRTTT